ncbi:hypothetical protein DBR11_24300 [Pedobacter sp. HMWF019]|uniref:hypothetical protein n=1 Tax=Pedobacter sp. HMWF019 TaxID=2056856 RepID=UPI000D38B5BE|nr:hypothetical protein [Pedobacter sp. HMWF019]PTS94005.1 hypothetical protein DBR11_24300 [Pedobacter sp. HMWF019]
MKKVFSIGFLFLLILSIGCSDTNSIGDDYEVSYVDMPINRNVYYKNQGIFDNLSVNMIVYSNDKILVRGYLFKNATEVDSSKYLYYYIDKGIYSSNPNQMRSNGLFGPIDSLEFGNIKNRLLDSKTLIW